MENCAICKKPIEGEPTSMYSKVMEKTTLCHEVCADSVMDILDAISDLGPDPRLPKN